MPNEKGMAKESSAKVIASFLLRMSRLKSSSSPAANIRYRSPKVPKADSAIFLESRSRLP